MEKRTWIILSSGLLVIFLAAVILLWPFFSKLWQKDSKNNDSAVSQIGTYDINDYQYELGKFPHDGCVGPITDGQDAIEKGTRVLTEIFGEEEVKNDKPFSAYYDVNSDTWILHGSVPEPPQRKNGMITITVGDRTLHIIMNASDGDVLAAWLTK